MGSISFDRIADRYDDTRGGERRGQTMAAEIEGHLGDARRILEVGIGTGVVAKGFERLGRAVVGIDISAEMLARAHERVGSRVARADAHALPVPTASVDATYLVWVLHLVGDPAVVVAECGRVLRPGGRLIAAAGVPRPDHGSDMTECARPLEPFQTDRPDTADAIASWAAPAGLERVAYRELAEPTHSTPADYADLLEKRTFSWMWGLDERTWEDEVQPVIDRLRTLPDPTREREVNLRRDLLVFEKIS